MLTLDSFVEQIEAFLKRSGMTPTAFGVAAVGDGNFVRDLREGRMPGLRLIGKVDAYIKAHDQTALAPSEAAE